MNLDIRVPIGLLFTALGLLLTVYGLVSDKAIYERSFGVNVNLWWGLVMLTFGGLMMRFGLRKSGDAPFDGATTGSPTSGH